jgi:hypothetical protein
MVGAAIGAALAVAIVAAWKGAPSSSFGELLSNIVEYSRASHARRVALPARGLARIDSRTRFWRCPIIAW